MKTRTSHRNVFTRHLRESRPAKPVDYDNIRKNDFVYIFTIKVGHF